MTSTKDEDEGVAPLHVLNPMDSDALTSSTSSRESAGGRLRGFSHAPEFDPTFEMGADAPHSEGTDVAATTIDEDVPLDSEPPRRRCCFRKDSEGLSGRGRATDPGAKSRGSDQRRHACRSVRCDQKAAAAPQ